MYAFANPTVFIDLSGNAATPFFSQPLSDQAFQIQPIGTIDTGNQFTDDFLSGGASVVNLALTVPNGVLNTLSLPSRAGGAATGQTAEQFDNQVGGLINSTGPLSPFLQVGSLPFRTASSLSKAAAAAKLNRLKGTTTRTSRTTVFDESDIPKIDSGPLPADTITSEAKKLEPKIESDVRESLTNQVREARSGLNSKLKREGNVASARVNIQGADVPTKMTAHSGIANPTDSQRGLGIVGDGSGNFKTTSLPNKAGVDVDRIRDSENKIMDNLSDMIGSNKDATGQVDILTELPACSSCTGVKKQFEEKHPNINVNIIDNDGNRIKP